MQKAIILGSSGQDGKILFKKLELLGYDIIGLTKEKSRSTIPEFTLVNILNSFETRAS